MIKTSGMEILTNTTKHLVNTEYMIGKLATILEAFILESLGDELSDRQKEILNNNKNRETLEEMQDLIYSNKKYRKESIMLHNLVKSLNSNNGVVSQYGRSNKDNHNG